MVEALDRPRRYMVVDRDTGEVVLDHVFLWGRSAKPVDKGFVKVFNLFMEDIATDPQITGKAVRLLIYMLINSHPGTLLVYLDPDDAAKALDVSRRTIERWIRLLSDRGYIKKLKPRLFLLRPYTGVKGNMTEAIENTQSWERRHVRMQKKAGAAQ